MASAWNHENVPTVMQVSGKEIQKCPVPISEHATPDSMLQNDIRYG